MLFFASASFAQKEVPTTAKTAFTKAFPNATKVKWDKENNDFEANFVLNGKEMSAVYDSNGILMETEEAIKISELPDGVADYVRKHYHDTIVKEASKITKANGEINYEAEIKGKDVLFDSSGKFIRDIED